MKVRRVKNEWIKLRVTRQTKELFRMMARKNGQDVSGFLRQIINQEIRKNGVQAPEESIAEPIESM